MNRAIKNRFFRGQPKSHLTGTSVVGRGLEGLENRLMMSTLTIDGGVLTYTAGDNVANELSVEMLRIGNSDLVFKDTAELINAPGLPGHGTNQVVVPGDALSSIVIDLGDRADELVIVQTHVLTQVNAGKGNDTIQVGRADVGMKLIGAGITVDGQGHDSGAGDVLRLADQAQVFFSSSDISYTIRGSSVSREVQGLTSAIVGYQGMEQVLLDAGPGADTITVRSTSPGTPVIVRAGEGDDTVNVGVFSPESLTFELVQEAVTVHGQGGTDVLSLNDQSQAFGRTYTIKADSLTSSAAAPVFHADVEHLTVNAGLSHDMFLLDSIAAGTSVVLDGGSGNDHFRMGTQKSIDGLAGTLSLRGNTGSDTIDYSSVSTNVSVNLSNGTATRVAGGVSGIENAFGGSGINKLTGDDNANILIGGPANDFLSGRGGRDLLIGGLGADVIDGGAGDDILIDGTTTYGLDLFALQAIHAEWTRTDRSYGQRISNLRNGSGLNGPFRLNSSTVFHDRSPDVLNGGDGLDWFWASADQLDRVLSEQLN